MILKQSSNPPLKIIVELRVGRTIHDLVELVHTPSVQKEELPTKLRDETVKAPVTYLTGFVHHKKQRLACIFTTDRDQRTFGNAITAEGSLFAFASV